MLSFLKKKKAAAPEPAAEVIPKVEEVKKPEKKQIFGTRVPKAPETNQLLEKLLGHEEGEADKAINKQKLGPGITCKVKIQSHSGSTMQDQYSNQQKLLSIFKIYHQDSAPKLTCVLKQAKGDQRLLLEFEFMQISQIHTGLMAQGRVTLQIVNEEDKQELLMQKQLSQTNSKLNQFSRRLPLQSILLSAMSAAQIQGILTHFQQHQRDLTEFTKSGKCAPEVAEAPVEVQKVVAQQISKKRTVHEMRGQQPQRDIINKHRKVIPGQRAGLASRIKVKLDNQPMKEQFSQSLLVLPWDCLEVILEFLPLNDLVEKHRAPNSIALPQTGSSNVKVYQTSRLLARDFYRMINRRRKGLLFKDADITERAFFDLMSKASGRRLPQVKGRSDLVSKLNQIHQFGIMKRLKNIKVSAFNKLITPLPGLRQLELQSCPTIMGEQGLSRLLMGCRNTLQYAGLPYGTAAVSHSTMMTLGTMPELTSLHLGSTQERLTLSRSLISNQTTTGGPSKLSALRSMFKEMLKKKHISKLTNLTLYECDEPVMDLIAKVASESLEKLAIVKWYQPRSTYGADFDKEQREDDLRSLQLHLCGDPPIVVGPPNPDRRKKFSKLERLNFCSTWFSIDVDRDAVDEQNDQAIAVTGNRDLELIFFGLKNTLIEIRLGEWAYNDLVVYIAEICKQLEIVEINSTSVNDSSILELLRKLQYLRFLDISGCPNVIGTAFADAQEQLASDKIRQITLGPDFNGQKMAAAKSRIHSKQPNVVFVLEVKKQYEIMEQ